MNRVLLLDVQDPDDGFGKTVVGVVEMTPELAKRILARGKIAKELKAKEPTFARLTFWDSPVDYYAHDDELTTEQSEELIDQCPVVVEKNPFPESSHEPTEYDNMNIDEDCVWWRTSSKHSGQMSTTGTISLSEIEEFIAED